MENYPAVLAHIRDVIDGLVNDVDVRAIRDFQVRVSTRGDTVDIQFPRADVEDFDVALQQHRQGAYFQTIEHRIRYQILLALGSAQLLGDFSISNIFANEAGDWPKDVRRDVVFDNLFVPVLQGGLKRLRGFLDDLLSKTDLEVPALTEDLENIGYLLSYLEENGNLSTAGASLDSLSYLKGAAICSLRSFEEQRNSSQIQRVRTALNTNIYSIASKLRQPPFDDIPPPDCAKEYLAHVVDAPDLPEVEASPAAIAPDAQLEIVALLEKLDERLVRRREGAWATFDSDNPDRLSQAANSMVELLDQVIAQICIETTLNDYLVTKFGDARDTKWVEVTRKWIGETKSNLHRVKHHTDYQSSRLTKALLESAESIIVLILSE